MPGINPIGITLNLCDNGCLTAYRLNMNMII